MKKIIISFFFCFIAISNAQDLNDWQVGLNLNPFMFSRINSKLPYQKEKQDFPNGFGFGLTIEKNWNENWGIKTAIESSKQNQKYFFDQVGNNTKIKSSFEYYKIPISIQYLYPIKEKLFLTFNQGFQFSFLKYYKTVVSDEYEIRTYTSNYTEFIFSQFPENNTYNPNYKGVNHNGTLFGIIGSVGLKGFLSDKISYSTNLRCEYDINSADNLPYYSSIPGNTEQESTTHNLRIGLELGIQYHFSTNNYRFDKRPHKL